MTAVQLPRHAPIAATFRGAHPENVHFGSLALVDASGRLLAHWGDVDTPVFTRSALKPFQAMPLVARWADRYALGDADIALLCASHSGEPMHTARVAELLARAHATENDLACGCHVPFFYDATGQAPPIGGIYSRLQHNCSGKHAGMLLMAHALGEPLTAYLDIKHPVQQAIAQSVSHFAGIAPKDLIVGIDGCSAPNYALPLRKLACAAARLTLDEPDPCYGGTPYRIARAMSRYPELVSGEGRSDLVLMKAGRGDWVSKVGADGVQVIASFSRQMAIAVKCSDGQLTPLMVALSSALDQLGWTDSDQQQALAALLPSPLRNAAGMMVGEMRPVLALTGTLQAR